MKTIYIGADHGGFLLKEKITKWLVEKKIPFVDSGNIVYDKNDDYPDYALKVASLVVQNKSKGILCCASAEGVCIAANKVRGIRAVNPASVIQTTFSRAHEDANVLCLAGGGSRKRQPAVAFSLATKMIMTFLETPFSGAKRHIRRLNKIKKIERMRL